MRDSETPDKLADSPRISDDAKPNTNQMPSNKPQIDPKLPTLAPLFLKDFILLPALNEAIKPRIDPKCSRLLKEMLLLDKRNEVRLKHNLTLIRQKN